MASEAKSVRLLAIYSGLVCGKVLTKQELAERFQITQRSVQRDMEALCCFFAEERMPQNVVYDRQAGGYRLVGFIQNIDRQQAFEKPEDLFPTIYRVDRIVRFREPGARFHPAYAGRFQEGEFRKRVQFMYGGRLQTIRFRYVGPSIEAVLDRLPTAKVLEEDEEGWTVEAEVFGKGVDMWLRSQGEYIKMIEKGGTTK